MTACTDGLTRHESGVLVWTGGLGARYQDPGEAVMNHCAEKLVPSCTERVMGSYHSGPCGNTPRHDPDANGRPTKCGNHSKAAHARRAAKKEATEARWKAQWRADGDVHDANKAVEVALRQIAEGHNDPRTLAEETIQRLDAARDARRVAYQKEAKA